MPPAGIRLGVDLGTSNTVAVVRWPDGRVRPLLFDGSPMLPSSVYAEPSGSIVVGRDAVHSARLEPARFEPNPKRRIDDGKVLLGDREIPVVELLTAVLRRVGDEWRRTVGDVEPDVTLTCPASWGATRRLSLADAATAAGLGRARLVAEPVAAATYFAQVLGRDVPIGSVVVVHDFGAGTFDASVVARTSSGFEVLAVDGRDDIGGLDLDEAVVRHVGGAVAEGDPASWQRLMQPSTVEERRARRLLWDDARVAKERLSRSPTADLTVPLLNTDVHLTREELEGLAKPLLEQTVRVTQGVIRWADVVDGRVAGVFLVGGSSRMPLVATLLHRALGEAPVAIEQPELVVAEGSILTGAAPVPVTAAPAPGPATGSQPKVVLSPPVASRPVPVSAPPGAGEFAGHAPRPVSGAPARSVPGGAGQVSGPPRASAAPPLPSVRQVSSAPVSPGAGAPVSPAYAPSGRPNPVAYGMPAAYGRPVSPAAAAYRHSPQAYSPQPQPYSAPRGISATYRSDSRPGGFGRLVRRALVTLLLVAVPIVAFLVSYRFASGAWPGPVEGWLGQ